MKTNLPAFLFLVLSSNLFSQSGIWIEPVVANQINLRQPLAVVLDSIIIDCPTAGKVFVRFDGNCISTPGDGIILAASDYPDWDTNDGNTSVIITDSNYTITCFDHARFYSVEAGPHTYYAVGHNYGDTAGSGIASIQGHLTVQFVPDGSPDAALSGIGIIDENWAWNDSIHLFPQTSLNAPGDGQLVINLDAYVVMPHEEQVLYTLNLEPAWPNNPVVFPVNFPADDENSTVMHRQVFPVTAGTHSINALVKFLSGDSTNTREYIYSTLSAQFIRDDNPDLQLQSNRLDHVGIDATGPELISQLQVTTSHDGKVWIHCNGICNTSLEDRIHLYVVPASHPNTIISEETLQPYELSNPDVHFSLSGLDSIAAGTHTYNLMIDYDSTSAGILAGFISGLFSIQFVANAIPSKVNDISSNDAFSIYPNPTTGSVYISSTSFDNHSPIEITLMNSSGQTINHQTVSDLNQYCDDLSGLPNGEYMLEIKQGTEVDVRSVVKTGYK